LTGPVGFVNPGRASLAWSGLGLLIPFQAAAGYRLRCVRVKNATAPAGAPQSGPPGHRRENGPTAARRPRSDGGARPTKRSPDGSMLEPRPTGPKPRLDVPPHLPMTDDVASACAVLVRAPPPRVCLAFFVAQLVAAASRLQVTN